jgi:small-conductance mechanosensitive channel
MLFIWAAHSHLELFLSFESNAPEKSPLSQLFWALMTALFVWILTKYRHVIDEMLFRNLSNRHNRLLINFQTSISGGVYYIIAGSIILGYVAWFTDYLTLFEYLRHQLLTTFVVLGSLSLMSYLIMLSHSYTHHKKISNITYRLIDIMALTATVYLVYCWIVPLIELYGNSPVNISDKIFGILVIVTITTLVVHGLNRFFSLSMVTAGKNKHLKTFLPILDRLSKLIVFVIATLLLLLELNVNIMPIVASFSILGLGVGLASKTIIEDFINGLFIIQENDFNIGDVVTVGTVTGTIENITLRKVHIRDAQGFLNFIPFSNVGIIVNRSRDYNVDKINIPLPSHFHLTRTVNILEDVGQQLLIDPDVKDYIISAPRFFGVAEFQLSPHPGSEVSTLMQFGVKTIPGKMTVVAGEFRKLAKLAFEEMERLM